MATAAQIRRRVVAAQGYASRARETDAAGVRACVRRLSCVQLDSISTVERSHRIVLASRVGAYDERVVSRLLRSGRVFEYWAHEACLVPIEDFPLFRRRMRERKEHHWWGDVIGRDKAMARAILRRIEREGPLRASDFEGRSGGMWDLKPEKRMLKALWTAGRLAIAGREGFQRVYDLVERVIPERYLESPLLSERAALRGMCLRAVEARGALTAAGVAEHYRIEGRAKTVQPHLDALVREGTLERVDVDDGGKPVYVVPGPGPGPRRRPGGGRGQAQGQGGVLLSPFDNLLWDRAFVRRFFGFDHVMEIYKRPHERKYGYYVLPFLHEDALKARVDVKSERDRGALVARAVHWEPGARSPAAEDALAKALARLARSLGLQEAATLQSS